MLYFRIIKIKIDNLLYLIYYYHSQRSLSAYSRILVFSYSQFNKSKCLDTLKQPKKNVCR
jgi:hypothetical protein